MIFCKTREVIHEIIKTRRIIMEGLDKLAAAQAHLHKTADALKDWAKVQSQQIADLKTALANAGNEDPTVAELADKIEASTGQLDTIINPPTPPPSDTTTP